MVNNIIVDNVEVNNLYRLSGFFQEGDLGQYILDVIGSLKISFNSLIQIYGISFWVYDHQLLNSSKISYTRVFLHPFEIKEYSGVIEIEGTNYYSPTLENLFTLKRRFINNKMCAFNNKISIYKKEEAENKKVSCKLYSNQYLSFFANFMPSPFHLYNNEYRLKYCSFSISNHLSDDYVEGFNG